MDEELKLKNRELVRSLQTQIDDILQSLIAPDQPVAHVGFPNHWNAGDSAIWLGTMASLERLGIKVAYQCSWQNYNRKLMAKFIGDGTILIAGGGNLGDLWLNHQLFREQILGDFRHNPVVQLSQSMWFDHENNLSRFQGFCDRHSNFRILVREHQSLRLASKCFSIPVSLCPDMAFGLGSLCRPTQASKDIVWLSRSDKESLHSRKQLQKHQIEVEDWLVPGPDETASITRASRYSRNANKLLSNATVDGVSASELTQQYVKLAQVRARRGYEILSRGKVVITDRLHGHILSLLMDLPNVVMDNRNRKVSNVHQSWTSASPLTTWAQSPDEAVSLAQVLIKQMSVDSGSSAA